MIIYTAAVSLFPLDDGANYLTHASLSRIQPQISDWGWFNLRFLPRFRGTLRVPAKTTTKPKTKSEKTTVKETVEPKTARGTTTVVTIAKATVAKGNGAHDNIYEDAVKEVVALSENDTYAKKIDNGPLSEARGKDTWRLHSQLRAVDQLDKNVSAHVSELQSALHEIDQHLHEDTVAVTNLVTQTQSNVRDWVTGTKESLSGDIETLTSTVKENFSKLAQATAGSEENLRSQTDSFSKAVENLLQSLQHDFDKKIASFQDEATRLIDKRFNQSDVAFAAIRADQEVIKALLTDIIKDRLGRPEPRSR